MDFYDMSIPQLRLYAYDNNIDIVGAREQTQLIEAIRRGIKIPQETIIYTQYSPVRVIDQSIEAPIPQFKEYSFYTEEELQEMSKSELQDLMDDLNIPWDDIEDQDQNEFVERVLDYQDEYLSMKDLIEARKKSIR